MSILDIFRGGGGQEQPQPQAPQGQQESQQQQQSAPPTDPNNNSQSQPTVEGQSAPSEPSLDAFDKLWENDPNAPQGSNFDPSQLFNIDPKQMQEAVGQINFAQVIPQDAYSRINEGGEAGQQAFMESMNAVARQVFTQAMVGSAKITEQAMSRANDHLDTRVQDTVRRTAASNSIRDSNPVFRHPAAEPMVKALESQLATKHPQASAQEITQMAEDYFVSLTDTFTKSRQPAQSQQSNDPNDVDWEAFFNS